MAEKSKVSFVHTSNRAVGVEASIAALGINPAKGKDVLIKPNFNTADAPPGSTHNDTLEALIRELWNLGAKTITVGERSYPPTRQVMERKGVPPLLKKLGVGVIDFDDLPSEDWVEVKPASSHWPNGFRVARPVLEAECLVYTPCLKTHQYGGVITMSLKLSVGVVPTSRHGFPYMDQLHSSPNQREMIAEINTAFSPDLIVLDGIETFVDGGPMTGRSARGDVFLASSDRVAVDAAGVAVLKMLGSNSKIMGRKVFEQDQIRRAAELGLGAGSADEIELVAADEDSRDYMNRAAAILADG
jgi:uncharacterized protein (DUF362 family)